MSSMVKTDDEIQKMRVAGKATAEVLSMIGEFVKPGVTTNELNDICHDFITNTLNATPSSLGYNGFPKSVCTSVNHQVCHGIPSDKLLKNGDIINIDITVEINGYNGDSSKMFLVGDATIKAKRLVEITQHCLYLGIQQVKPGGYFGDIGAVIQEYAEKNHYSVVREYCGHGIGQAMHEDPQILHYGTAGTGLEMLPGMIFTIEPMINIGKRFVKLLPIDNWTVVTKDRSLSAQWEHTILVTNTGHEVLTKREEETDLP